MVLIIWAFPSLASWLPGLAAYIYQTEGDYGECGWCGGQKAQCGVTALYRGQEDSTIGESLGKTCVAASRPQDPTIPYPPTHWAPWEDMPEAMGRHV